MNEECEGIEGATIEVYATDSSGTYNYFLDPDQIGCFGHVKSDKDGKYSFLTWKPGTFGVTSGILSFDIPPYLPQHIHVTVYKFGYKLLSTQLYFPDDKAREFDWRGYLFRVDFQTNNPKLFLHEEKSSEKQPDKMLVKHAKYDFVLENDPTNTPPEQQIYTSFCEQHPPHPLALCYPVFHDFLLKFGLYHVLPFMLVAAPWWLFGVALFVVYHCFCGTSSTHSDTLGKKKKLT